MTNAKQEIQDNIENIQAGLKNRNPIKISPASQGGFGDASGAEIITTGGDSDITDTAFMKEGQKDKPSNLDDSLKSITSDFKSYAKTAKTFGSKVLDNVKKIYKETDPLQTVITSLKDLESRYEKAVSVHQILQKIK